MDDGLARNRLYLVTLVLFGLILVGTVFVLRRPEPTPLAIVTTTPRPTPTIGMIMVDVRGAVNKPGVYTLAVGSRVQDVLVLAGNPLSDAETRQLNLARKLNDGEQIYIPTFAEATLTPPVAAAKSNTRKTPVGKININTATVSELDPLPGIGPALAERIVEYRSQFGPFRQLEDIKKVRGIGDALYKQIQDLITLE